ncbi:VWD domain-containing protein [Actinomarinicola tropica]|uniref:VWD domain-containing protein n=1 Tax=Actinomarinicola tropica TaxID=2789776 RepID=UPI001899B282|nr:VWD domain-containing protein [Actinomarinicola tropica]
MTHRRHLLVLLVAVAALGLTACQGGDPCDPPTDGGPIFNVEQAQGVADCPPPCDGCGGGTGEPHLVTFDERRYDLQSAAELVAARDRDGTFEVQWRQEPYGNHPVASITAVAMRIGDVRLSVVGGDEVVRLDGEVLDLEPGEGRILPTGVVVHRRDEQVVVTHEASGSSVHVQMSTSMMGVLIDPPDEAEGRMEGLLGDADGDPSNDLVGPDGSVLDGDSWESVHPALAEAWRVDDDSTLFDYEDGAGPDTYWDPTFPPAPVDDLDDEALDAARALCAAAGVTDAGLLEECAFDLVVTGDASLVDVYVLQQKAMGIPLGDEVDTAPDEPTLDVVDDAVVWTAVLDDRSRPVWGDATDRVALVHVETGDDGVDTLIALDARSGEELWAVDGVEPSVPATIAGDLVVVATSADGPLAGPAGERGLAALDLATGASVDEVRFEPDDGEAPIDTGSTLHLVGGVVVHVGNGVARGLAPETLELRWTTELPGRTDLVPAVDGDRIWLGWRDGDGTEIAVLDPANGELTARDVLDGRPSAPTARAVADGALVVALRGEATAWVRLDVEGDDISTAWVHELDEDERGADRLAISGRSVVGYTDADVVSAVGLDDGRRLWDVTTTSFNNNDEQVAATDGGATIVGSFGGAYLEAFDADGGELWLLDPSDVARTGSPGSVAALGRAGDLVVATSPADGAVIVVAVALD